MQYGPENRRAPSITLDTSVAQGKDLRLLYTVLGNQHVTSHCTYSTRVHAHAETVLTLWTDRTVYITYQGMASHTGHREIYRQENPSGPSAGHSHYPGAFPNKSW